MNSGKGGRETDPEAVRESLAWARALVLAARPRFGSALWSAQHNGSRAVVACLDGDVALAGYFAEAAAHCAFRAVPALRG